MRFREVERNVERENLTNNDYDFDKRIGEEGFRKIKPEGSITFEEAKDFLEALFDPEGRI